MSKLFNKKNKAEVALLLLCCWVVGHRRFFMMPKFETVFVWQKSYYQSQASEDSATIMFFFPNSFSFIVSHTVYIYIYTLYISC